MLLWKNIKQREVKQALLAQLRQDENMFSSAQVASIINERKSTFSWFSLLKCNEACAGLETGRREKGFGPVNRTAPSDVREHRSFVILEPHTVLCGSSRGANLLYSATSKLGAIQLPHPVPAFL